MVRLLVIAATAGLIAAPLQEAARGAQAPLIGGPYGRLLAHSTDLGSASGGDVELVVALREFARPLALIRWADDRGLSARWRPGAGWAIVAGHAEKVSAAFAVEVHDYRTGDGRVFYASPRQPAVPARLRPEVTDLGRILGYGRRAVARPPVIPQDVPGHALTPHAMMTAYNAGPLGVTGRGQIIVFFELGDYDPADLQEYAAKFQLPAFDMAPPIGGMPPHNDASGETTMDLEAVHAVAPDARLVVVNANAYVSEKNFAWSQVESMFDAVDHDYPGAVWSSSITVAPCDRILTSVDSLPARSALAAAERHGTSAFDAAGDTAGLECKEYRKGQWGAPPTPDDIGLDPIASLPEMTDVGGTTLSTDANGVWVAEATWVDYAMQQGTGGGVSANLDRPDWQRALAVSEDSGQATHRLTPDVAAVADVQTGIMVKNDKKWEIMGGTSLAAPLWAGFAALMNEYLLAHGGQQLGNLNPLLYRAAAFGSRPAFHDVILGGNVVHVAGPGYDLATGLGTPDVDNLVHDILDIQRAGG